jgi:hypothetical protein
MGARGNFTVESWPGIFCKHGRHTPPVFLAVRGRIKLPQIEHGIFCVVDVTAIEILAGLSQG